MSRLYVNDYINNLQQQISYSVAQIRQKSSSAQTNTDAASEERVSRPKVDSYAYSLLSGGINWTLQQETKPDSVVSGYAAASYQSAGNVLREPTVLIDFMFKNNREFDFKV